MSSDPRLCALADFDFNSRTGVEIFLMNTEAAGCNLDDRIFPVTIKILMKAALTGII